MAPRTAAVFAGAAGDTCQAWADRCCEYINFATSARAARGWAGRHLDVGGRVLRQAQALRHGIAEFANPDDAPSRRSPLTARTGRWLPSIARPCAQRGPA